MIRLFLILLIISLVQNSNSQIIEFDSKGQLIINGTEIKEDFTISDIKTTLGNTSRDILLTESQKVRIAKGYLHDNYYIFDSLGIEIIQDGKTDRIEFIRLYYTKPNWESKYIPGNTFTGEFSVNGYEVLDISISEFQDLSHRYPIVEDLTVLMVGDFELEFKRISPSSDFYSLSIQTRFNKRNNYGWSHREKAILMQHYAEDANFLKFCSINDLNLDDFLRCLLNEVSNEFPIDKFLADQIDNSKFDSIFRSCHQAFKD